LDGIGRVIDFSVLKEKVGTWIDENWDHGFIYMKGDLGMEIVFKDSDYKNYPMTDNPTAENMAKHLVEDICPELMKATGVEVHKVVLWETENCHAIYSK
tara:strand:+ start:2289 stop:2585 length:297 start_codon:yes stop_codon:yes gene_type:complete